MEKSLTKLLLVVATALSLATGANAEEKKSETSKKYQLDTCVVSGEKLGDHGKPYVFTHEGQEVKLCCKGCLKDFKKEPSKYIKKVDKDSKKSK